MFAGLVVEVEGPLGLDSWAAIFVCPFVVLAAMVCSRVAIFVLPPKLLGGSITAGVFGICLDTQ